MLKQLLNIIIFLSFLSMLSQEVLDSTAIAYAVEKNKSEMHEEQLELNFKSSFFDALQQKAIGNFDRAIEALEKCNDIKPNNVAVNFELGKNYFQLNKYFEAENYLKKGLENDSENIALLMLLKDIYNKQNNFKEALEIQKKLAAKKRGQQLDLVILYIKNNLIEDARNLLIELEENGTLSANLIPFKESLFKGTVLNSTTVVEEKTIDQQTIEEVKLSYEHQKSFPLLKELLIKLQDKRKYLDLERQSKEGLELFPAQPFVYLMYGISQNQLKNYENALSTLQNGIDYVIDDSELEADFYDQIALSLKGMGKNVDASNYLKKAASLRQKKS